MELLQDTQVCADVANNSCDVVYRLTGNEFLAVSSGWLIGKPLAILGLVLLGVVARWVLHKAIDRVTARAADGGKPNALTRRKLKKSGQTAEAAAHVPNAARRVQRARTIGSLMKSTVTGVVFAIVLIMAIAELGYNVAPLIASAGIIGLAIGFGAQSLVTDFLAGIFMIIEDQYGVGDVVDLEYAIGTVENVSLRVTRLRDIDGTVWYVRNGEILRVGNSSQNWARTVLDVPVGYSESLPRVTEVLKDVAHDLWLDEEFKNLIIEEPEVWGVQELGADAVVVRVALKTAPMEQWGIARELRARIKARFDYENIEIPLPQRVVWHRQMPGAPARAEQDEPVTAGTNSR